jgi:hypothetical protein
MAAHLSEKERPAPALRPAQDRGLSRLIPVLCHVIKMQNGRQAYHGAAPDPVGVRGALT